MFCKLNLTDDYFLCHTCYLNTFKPNETPLDLNLPVSYQRKTTNTIKFTWLEHYDM